MTVMRWEVARTEAYASPHPLPRVNGLPCVGSASVKVKGPAPKEVTNAGPT